MCGNKWVGRACLTSPLLPPVLTGTGKTVYVKKQLQEGLPPTMTSTFMTFSAQTSANMTQDIIDGKLDKRKRGIYGPPQNKRMVIFVDDLNMPQVRA